MSGGAIQWSRAQRAAIEIGGRDLLVSAGAGTGKTTVLVARILNKLRTGAAQLDQLLVVTFTEKAAREMKERLHRALRDDPELRREILRLPSASISTIDAFCARLLRQHFVEASVEPAFRVLDERGTEEALDQSLRRVFHERYQGSSPAEFLQLVEMAGYDEEGERLRKVVRRLRDFARTSDDPQRFLGRLTGRQPATSLLDLPGYEEWCARTHAQITRAGSLLRAALELAQRDGIKVAADHATQIDALLGIASEELRGPVAQRQVSARLQQAGVLRDKGGRLALNVARAPKGANAIPHYEAMRDAAKDLLATADLGALPLDPDQLLGDDARVVPSIRALGSLVQAVDDHYQAFKDRNGFLDFSDLEQRALVLLLSHASALGLDQQFREVMVDEFQDVNRLQHRLLSLLSQGGRSFHVGDVKQSIYQFRLADPSVFLAAASAARAVEDPDRVPEGNDPLVVYLRENHRSAAPILEFVNRLFGSLFGAATIGSSYAEQALQTPPGKDSASAPRVELHWVLTDAPRPPDDAAAEPAPTVGGSSADASARAVAEWLRDWGATQSEPRWNDVAILLRTARQSEPLLPELAACGIPAVMADAGRLLDQPLARDLVTLLRVLDNPRDDVTLSSLLRSPFVSVSDDELYRIRLRHPHAKSYLDAVLGAAMEAGADDLLPELIPSMASEAGAAPLREEWIGEADPRVPLAAELSARLGTWLRSIVRWRSLAETVDLSALLSTLRRETRLQTLAAAFPEAKREKAAVARVVALAGEFEAERGPSLRGFLARLDALDRVGKLPAVAQGDVDRQAVTLLTVHKAKGLEFPIVILPRVEWKFREDSMASRIRLSPEDVGLSHLDFESWTRHSTLAQRMLGEVEKENSRQEEARVLYVALTRAKTRLVLVGAGKDPIRDAAPPPLLRQHRIETAGRALDWLQAVLPWEEVADQAGTARAFRTWPLDLFFHQRNDLLRRRVATMESSTAVTVRAAEQPVSAELLREVRARVEREADGPSLAALAELKGKYWVTEFKRKGERAQFAERRGDDPIELWVPGLPQAEEMALTGSERGTLYHAVLDRLDLSRVDRDGLQMQFEAFAHQAWWTAGARDAELEAGIQGFFASSMGERLARAAREGRVEREAPFSLRWSVEELRAHHEPLRVRLEEDPAWATEAARARLGEAWVLLQGRFDCVIREQDEVLVLDWKTDRVSNERLALRAGDYRPQLLLYADAAARIYRAPASGWLVFLSTGDTVPVRP